MNSRKQIPKLTGWVFPTITDAWKGGDSGWFETTKEVFDEQLTTVPPMRDEYTSTYSLFFVGEMYDWDAQDNPMHTLFIEIKPTSENPESRFFCKLANINIKVRAYVKELLEVIYKEAN